MKENYRSGHYASGHGHIHRTTVCLKIILVPKMGERENMPIEIKSLLSQCDGELE